MLFNCGEAAIEPAGRDYPDNSDNLYICSALSLGISGSSVVDGVENRISVESGKGSMPHLNSAGTSAGFVLYCICMQSALEEFEVWCKSIFKVLRS